MAIRRTTAPRKRPIPVGSSDAGMPQVSDEAVAQTAVQEVSVDPQDTARELLGQFEEYVRSDPSLSGGNPADLIGAFAESLRQMVDSGEFTRIPDEAEWQETLDTFKGNSKAIDSNSSGLERMLAGAAAVLERRETKVAMEFSRRLQADGQERALAWLREQQHLAEATSSEKAATADPAPVRTPALRSEVTSSRSRRLRGPPKG